MENSFPTPIFQKNPIAAEGKDLAMNSLDMRLKGWYFMLSPHGEATVKTHQDGTSDDKNI